MEPEKTFIEINGAKFEVDLRYAKRVEELRVGDRVKVLIRDYADKATVYFGVIVGFEPFKTLPTVIVAYVEPSWQNVAIKFLYYNTDEKKAELVKSVDDDKVGIEKANILGAFDREIAKLQAQIEDLEARKEYFVGNFGAYWEPIAKEESA